MNAVEWDDDKCPVCIGSRSIAESAYQVCNEMSQLLRDIHCGGSWRAYSDVSIWNLKVNIRSLIECEYAGNYNGCIFYLIELMEYYIQDMEYSGAIKYYEKKCHSLWLKILEILMNEFTWLKLFAKPRSQEELSKMFNN